MSAVLAATKELTIDSDASQAGRLEDAPVVRRTGGSCINLQKSTSGNGVRLGLFT